MSAEHGPLRVHMREPDVTEHDAAEAWRAVNDPPRGRATLGGWRVAGLATLAASAVVLALLSGNSTKVGARPGAVPAAPAVLASSGPRVSVLADGSRLVAAAGTTLRTLESNGRRVRLRLESGGSADFDVVPNAERTFSVHAGDYEIIVVGTRFVVAFSKQQRAAVEVKSGAVRVTRDGALVALLHAGDSWSEEASSTTSFAGEQEPSTTARAAPPLEPGSKPKDAAAELFDRANRARLAGKAREAAGLFDELRKRHPGHALAGLAAFELGRIRLDNLGDPAGAAEALGSALSLAPAAPFREDVEARRVQALENLGSLDACRIAKDAYLSRYPSGAHRARVARRCEPK